MPKQAKRGVRLSGGISRGWLMGLIIGAAGGCDQRVSKAWDGGKVEARLSASACPSSQPAEASAPAKLVAEPECRYLIDDAFNATVEMNMIGSLIPSEAASSRREIWHIGCDGRCDVAVLYPESVFDGRIGAGTLSAFSGRATRRRGKVFEIRLNAIGDSLLTVDLDAGAVNWVQTDKLGGRVTGQGTCNKTAKR